MLLGLLAWGDVEAQTLPTLVQEVVSREFSVFVGEPSPPTQIVTSREVSVVAGTEDVPAPVTCLDCGFTVRDSVNFFSALDLDWTVYNDIGQKDVVRYRVYLGPTFFDDLSALSPFMYVPAETKQCTVQGLDPYGIYYVAVVAEDVLEQINPIVRSQSAQASVDRVCEVQNLAVIYGENALTLSWQPPEGADPNTNNLLAAYHLYLAGAETPLVLDRFAQSHTLEDLLFGHGYPVIITTVDNLGRESEGASRFAATLVPNPLEITAYSFYGITRVAWARLPAEEVIDSFDVFMATTNFTSVAGMTPVRTTRGHSVDFLDLMDGKTYYFAVVSRNIGGCSSQELPIQVVSVMPGETVPTILQAGGYTNGIFDVLVNGPLGAQHVLMGSTNLNHWIRVRTNIPMASPFLMTVTNIPGTNWFYRVKIE